MLSSLFVYSSDTFSEMAESWGSAAYAARRQNQDTTRESSFTFTNSNNTKGESATTSTLIETSNSYILFYLNHKVMLTVFSHIFMEVIYNRWHK